MVVEEDQGPWKGDWLAVSMRLRAGNSGGPVIDARGDVEGLSTIMAGPEIGLAVPLHVAEGAGRILRGGDPFGVVLHSRSALTSVVRGIRLCYIRGRIRFFHSKAGQNTWQTTTFLLWEQGSLECAPLSPRTEQGPTWP
jgi:hypothetical protein